MPGFVDAHRHLWQSLIRNLDIASGADVSAHFTPDDVYAATLVGLLQALEAGITTVVDWCDVSGDAAHLEAALSAHADCRRANGARHVDLGRDAIRLTSRSPVPRPTSSRPSWTRSRRDGPGPRSGTADPRPCRHGRSVARRSRRTGSPRSAGARRHVVPLHPPERRRFRRDRRVVDRGGTHPGERHGRRVGATPMQQLIDRGIRPGLGRRRRAAHPRRRLRPDAGRHLRPARHVVRSQAGRQGRRAQPARHPRRDSVRHDRGCTGRRALRRHRIAESGQARRHHRVAGGSSQHRPGQRPDRCRRVGHGHVERRLGVRRRHVAGRARRAHRRCGAGTRLGDGGPATRHRSGAACSPTSERRSHDRRTRRRRRSLTRFVVASRYHAGLLRPDRARRRGLDLGSGDAQQASRCRRSLRLPLCSRSPHSARCW